MGHSNCYGKFIMEVVMCLIFALEYSSGSTLTNRAEGLAITCELAHTDVHMAKLVVAFVLLSIVSYVEFTTNL